ncbi:MAG: hypothetical protein KAT39_08220 [Alphaproteobacteria bacterium]|nr:hypothetical protein [Alphaproteobacteria bacterium]
MTGAIAGWLVHAVVPGDWHPLIGMAPGMLLGMIVGVVGGLLFGPLFGDLETTLPAMLSGMVAGSFVGMLQVGAAAALWGGALAGLACLAYTYVWQARLHGKVK